MSFKGKVVLVTGASSGIGAAIAKHFAKEGAKVTIVGRNQINLNNVTEQIEKIGEAPLVINADLAKDAEGKRIVDETVKHFGKLDVLVNNAGFSKHGCLTDGNILQSYDAVMSVNVRAVLNITYHAFPHLKATKGNIVNISAVASMMVSKNPNLTSYFISKAALDKFTQVAALELASFGVRVNSVNPGPVATDFAANAKSASLVVRVNSVHPGSVASEPNLVITPLKRVSDPEEIADLTLFLASDKARGITGSLYVSDNGAMLSY